MTTFSLCDELLCIHIDEEPTSWTMRILCALKIQKSKEKKTFFNLSLRFNRFGRCWIKVIQTDMYIHARPKYYCIRRWKKEEEKPRNVSCASLRITWWIYNIFLTNNQLNYESVERRDASVAMQTMLKSHIMWSNPSIVSPPPNRIPAPSKISFSKCFFYAI